MPDFLERVAACLPDEALNKYLDTKKAISVRREELWRLRDILIDIARTYGVPDLDYPTAESNERICEALGAAAIEINSVWASAPQDWSCPCCQRTKTECARLGTKGQMLGKLVAHHDHFEDYMEIIPSELSKVETIEVGSAVEAKQFVKRGTDLFMRFDRIVICEDCNNAEASGKEIVGAAPCFTFTPREIASFVRASPHQSHEVDRDALAEAYASAERHFELRAAALRRLAEHALRGTAWYEPVAFEHRDDQIDRHGRQVLGMFGLDHVGPGTIHEIFFKSRRISPKHAPAWRTKLPPEPLVPTEGQLELATRGNAMYGELADDWTCPCCHRAKRDIVRWSQNSKQFMFRIATRNVPDPSARYGTRKVTVCDACNHAFQECHKELRTRLGGVSMPDYPVTIDELGAVIVPRPYTLHPIDPVAAEILVDRIISKLSHGWP